MCSTSASIDSNRAVERKVLLCVFVGCLYIVQVRLQISLQLNRKPSNSRFCYMVKPHEQLVLVSSTPRSASTPNLSTS
jgi:Na+/H+-dicarboxylate symporter